MAAPEDEERARKVARAWTLHNRRWSSRAIGAELGVSHVTAQAWIEQARQEEEWREVTESAGRRARMGGFLNELTRIGTERLLAVDEDGNPRERWKDVVPGLMTVVQELNRVEGNYAPLRMTMDDRRPPDPVLRRAMELEAQRAAAEDEAETRKALEE